MNREKQIDTPTQKQFTVCEKIQIGEMAAMIYAGRKIQLSYVEIAANLCEVGYRKQEWISVDERLPEENTEVLIYCKTNSGKEVFFVDKIRYFRGLAIWQAWNGKVTHWMPLPEAPKMKGGGE